MVQNAMVACNTNNPANMQALDRRDAVASAAPAVTAARTAEGGTAPEAHP